MSGGILTTALARLDATERLVVLMLYAEELTPAEAAKVLGVSVEELEQMHRDVCERVRYWLENPITAK